MWNVLYTIQISILYIREYFLRGVGTIESSGTRENGTKKKWDSKCWGLEGLLLGSEVMKSSLDFGWKFLTSPWAGPTNASSNACGLTATWMSWCPNATNPMQRAAWAPSDSANFTAQWLSWVGHVTSYGRSEHISTTIGNATS